MNISTRLLSPLDKVSTTGNNYSHHSSSASSSSFTFIITSDLLLRNSAFLQPRSWVALSFLICRCSSSRRITPPLASSIWYFGPYKRIFSVRIWSWQCVIVTRIIRITTFTRITKITRFTWITITRSTRITRVAKVGRITRFTSIIRFTKITRLSRFCPAFSFSQCSLLGWAQFTVVQLLNIIHHWRPIKLAIIKVFLKSPSSLLERQVTQKLGQIG